MKLSAINVDIKSSTLDKLIDVTSKAIGELCAPALLRKKAKAKGQEILTIGESMKDLRESLGIDAALSYQNGGLNIQLPSSGIEKPTANFERRIEERLARLEANRQRNLDKVTLFAVRNIDYEKQPSADPVDDDWASKFFNAARDISSEQMQEVWGKILAREVERPGSFTPRSLDTLQALSKEEARLFQHILQYKVVTDDEVYIVGNDISQVRPDGKRWYVLLLMRELHLVQESIFITKFDCDSEMTFLHYGLQLQVKEKMKQSYEVYGALLTKVGRELSNLIEHDPNVEFFTSFRDQIDKQGCDTVLNPSP